MKPTKSLVENVNWNEIATLTRLAFVAGSHSKQAIHTQLYIPEIVHLVTLTAGTGPTLVRKSVYGIVLNYLQTLYSARREGEEVFEVLSLIEEFAQPSILSLFGLARTNSSSEYSDLDPPNDQGFLETQEGLTELLIRVMETTAGTRGTFVKDHTEIIYSSIFRLAECMAGSMDGFSRLNGLPALSCYPVTRIHCHWNAGHFRRR
jgi:hypothetical protein